MISSRVLLAAALLVFSLSAVAGDAPPADVLTSFDAAIVVEDAEDFLGSYVSTMVSTVQKPNGKGRHDNEMVMAVDRPKADAERRTLVTFVMDGKDVADKHREEIEGIHQDDDADDGDDGMDFVPPWGDDSRRYAFDSPIGNGSTVVQGFSPLPGQKETEGLAVGQLVWHADTLDPISVELEVTDPPAPLKDMKIEMEFERQGDRVFATRMVTDGLAKVLLMKREFHVDVRWTDIQPAEVAP